MIKNETTVDGFCDFLDFYQKLAGEVSDGGKFAEIGVFRGSSLISLILETKKLGKNNIQFYALDEWKGRGVFSSFFQNCIEYGVNDKITPVRGPSALTLLGFPAEYFHSSFIDGNHSYEFTCRDIELCLEKTKYTIAGHDIHLSSVKRSCDRMFGLTNYETTGNCWIYRKNKERI